MAPSEKIIADESTIGQYIPQQQPMVMIGKLLSVDENKTVTSFVIKKDNIFVMNDLFREAGMIENMAQTAAAAAGFAARQSGLPPRVGFIGGIKNLEISILPEAGKEIVTEVVVEEDLGESIIGFWDKPVVVQSKWEPA